MMKMYEGLGHLLASDSLKANLAWLKSNPWIYESQKKEKKLYGNRSPRSLTWEVTKSNLMKS